ncbi:MAG TPA: hypothetical protein VFP87_11100 [Chitinophagaceae bacterium]|nr:hypothetical protein [Chitinophagaceae bacterium]
MKSGRTGLIALLIFAFALGTCKKDEPFVICGNRCPSGAPWRVESLDLGLPCFGTKEACMSWASSHGYGDKDCVQCD